jgi:DNA-binding response OmpR family regulator
VQKRILIVEDEPAIRDMVAFALRKDDYEPVHAGDGREAQAAIADRVPDLILLDWMLPGGSSGLELARRWRREALTREVPIIMLTARGDDMDVVAGLEAGADDYVVKPVQARVLEARIRAVLRRTGRDQAELERHGDLTIDRAGLVVANRGVPVSLTPTELRLLLELSGTPGRVHSRQQLLESVWEYGYLGDSRLVDACVQRLRAKIEDDSAAPVYVQTVRGFGYRFGPV